MKKLLYLLVLLFVGVTLSAQKLVWDKNPETDIAGYKVYVKIEGMNQTASVSPPLIPETEYSLTNLINGRRYFFNVTAVNFAGLESDFSDTVAFSKPLGIPPAPIVLSSSISRQGWFWSYSMSWGSPPDGYFTTGYRVYVIQSGTMFTNFMTTNTNIFLTLPVKSPTSIYLQATNYVGESQSQTPVVVYSQPGQAKGLGVIRAQ